MDKRKIIDWKWKKRRNPSNVIQYRVRGVQGRGGGFSGNWRRWHTEDFRDQYSLAKVILPVTSRRTDVLVCDVCGVGAYYGFWWGNLRERNIWRS